MPGGTDGPDLRLISWNITLRCPLRCAHCYVNASEHEAEGVLSTDEAYAVIDQICEMGRPVVILSGGEPLMRDDIFRIARYGTKKGLVMAMGTSGVLIDETCAREIRDSGIRKVAISIDSADPSVHDSFRGLAGAWDRAVQGIRHCVNEGIGVQINTTVLSPDIQAIKDVVSLGTGLGVSDYQLSSRSDRPGERCPVADTAGVRRPDPGGFGHLAGHRREHPADLCTAVPADCRHPWHP